MAHRIFGRHLGRNTKERKQLFRSLAVSIIEKGRITTTLAKAKAVRSLVERLVTLAKASKLGIKRLALAELGNNQASWQILVNKIAKTFSDTPGGYTRIIKLGVRSGDGAPKAILEWSKEIVTTENKTLVPKPARKLKRKEQ